MAFLPVLHNSISDRSVSDWQTCSHAVGYWDWLSLVTRLVRSICRYSAIFTALHCMQRGIGDRKAIRPSVRPSNAWIVIKRRKFQPTLLYQKDYASTFVTWRMVG